MSTPADDPRRHPSRTAALLNATGGAGRRTFVDATGTAVPLPAAARKVVATDGWTAALLRSLGANLVGCCGDLDDEPGSRAAVVDGAPPPDHGGGESRNDAGRGGATRAEPSRVDPARGGASRDSTSRTGVTRVGEEHRPDPAAVAELRPDVIVVAAPGRTHALDAATLTALRRVAAVIAVDPERPAVTRADLTALLGATVVERPTPPRPRLERPGAGPDIW